jgi:hypothetical protein
MIAKLQRVEKAAANESLVLETSSREAPMLAQHATCGPQCAETTRSVGRRLRNRLILANAITWIVIIVLIRLVFF